MCVAPRCDTGGGGCGLWLVPDTACASLRAVREQLSRNHRLSRLCRQYLPPNRYICLELIDLFTWYVAVAVAVLSCIGRNTLSGISRRNIHICILIHLLWIVVYKMKNLLNSTWEWVVYIITLTCFQVFFLTRFSIYCQKYSLPIWPNLYL